MPLSAELVKAAESIQLVALDVDGVMTSGTITYTASGEEIKSFDVKDGHGIAMLVKAGFQVAIITARESAVVARRAKELGIQHVVQMARPKLPALEQLIQQVGVSPAQVAYMGDDFPDIGCMKLVGLAACPADAVAEVKAVSHWVTEQPGGQGAVRALCDVILYSQDKLTPFLSM